MLKYMQGQKRRCLKYLLQKIENIRVSCEPTLTCEEGPVKLAIYHYADEFVIRQ